MEGPRAAGDEGTVAPPGEPIGSIVLPTPELVLTRSNPSYRSPSYQTNAFRPSLRVSVKLNGSSSIPGPRTTMWRLLTRNSSPQFSLVAHQRTPASRKRSSQRLTSPVPKLSRLLSLLRPHGSKTPKSPPSTRLLLPNRLPSHLPRNPTSSAHGASSQAPMTRRNAEI